MRKLVLILLLILLSSLQAAAQQRCLSYEPMEVKVGGTISRIVFPGPPNYLSVKRGDTPETSWVLHLLKPICVEADGGDINVSEKGVTDLQLILDQEEFARYRKFVQQKRRVLVNGKLTHAITGHHHTRVLLEVTEIKASS